MTIKEADALVRENALNMLQSDALTARYITSLNMLCLAARGTSPGMLRLKPEAVKAGTKERPEAL